MMDSVPHDDVVHMSGERPTHCKGVPQLEAAHQQREHVATFARVRQKGNSMSAIVVASRVGVFRPLNARGEGVLDEDGALSLEASERTVARRKRP